MNKSSFVLGVFVGALFTWIVTIYLYYSLNSSELNAGNSVERNIFNIMSDESESEGDDSNEKQSNHLNQKDDKDSGKSSYIKNRFRKEKYKRKLSRKLIEELRPITIKQDSNFGLIKNVEDQFIRDNGYKTHAFNVLVSQQIGNYREIPDTRHKV
jgi:polypeptide N-acetylgalactosaminyltransferase